MLFNTLEFSVFFTVVYSLYWGSNHKWQNHMLLIASCVFYGAWNWKFLVLMFISISTDYFCSNYIYRSNDVSFRRRLLFLSIFVNLSILAFFKYFNFFIVNMASLLEYLHVPVDVFYLKIILPVGISFYTFEAISYTVDVYKGRTPPAKSFLNYALFITYFPHLIAGPIMRAKSFLPQIEQPRQFRWDDLKVGAYLFAWGFFQKSFIADNLARSVDPVFAATSYEGYQVLLASYAFAFQIYCDFSGYSNMARGLGKSMGFDIVNNFEWPYFSSNPQEFWRRWHISLSTWLRDYLYIPLGGSQGNFIYICRNLLITMFLAGLWHGAAWTFVLWGVYHAFLLIFHRMVKKEHSDDKKENGLISGLKIFLFFQLLCVGWIMFRARSFTQLYDMLYALFFNFHWDPAGFMGGLKNILFYTWFLLLIEGSQKRRNDLLLVLKWPVYLKCAVFIFMFYSLAVWGNYEKEDFIYFVF